MPWSIRKRGNKFEVVKDADDSVEGTHMSRAEAEAQMRALHASEHSTLVAFEPFANLKPGQPIKILPTGKWFRGSRILDITRERLEEVVANFRKGLPRFRVGIDLDHAEDKGKVGELKNIAFMEDGPMGGGLYATDYQLTEKGKRAIEEDGYDAVSAEVVWSLNDGARYQDPETGAQHDNVLVGLALTPRPFFGHREVALFHATPDDFRAEDPPEERSTEMADEKIVEQLAEKSAEVERLTAEVNAAKSKAEELEAQIQADKLTARKEGLKTEAEAFKAISMKPDEFAEVMVKLDDATAAIVRGWLKSADEAAKGITEEEGSDLSNEEQASAKFLLAVDGIAKAEKLTYDAALQVAMRKFPELATEYAGTKEV